MTQQSETAELGGAFVYDETTTTATPNPPKVYAAIAAVSAELAKRGMAKEGHNDQGKGYYFRGIDQVLNALASLLSQHGLVILPRVVSHTQVERTAKSGNALFATTIEAQFDFVAVEDGSRHTVTTYGEAFDSGDKGTNKAMSAAYKYAAFLAFCIPIQGTPDADATTPEESAPTKPEGYDDFSADFLAVADEGVDRLRQTFKDAPPAFRDYLMKHDTATYAAATAKAKA